MKTFFKDKKKLMILSVMVLLTLVACKTARNADGTINPEMIISLDTGFGETLSTGWFDGLIVWPIATLINFISQYTDAGVAIIIVTALINILISACTLKSQISAQRIQMLQPELNKIQQKYAGKSDQRSQMMQAQEMQALYKKYDINPFTSILGPFLQLPVIMGMYLATQRSEAVINGSFMGISLEKTVQGGISEGMWVYLLIFALMVFFQFLALKFPQWLQKWKKKKNHVKEKKYAEPEKKAGGMAGSMNMMMYMSTILIAWLGFTWPLGMSFYWLVSSIVRIIQNIVISQFFMKD
ncbi:MAG: YidC/Oxa1 family membrane protein insertase [Erysipelotrichaceae bacterium]|jgi:YidC/Oxa1 family membrane protein insertase|nr:YidC/Oxa1 family membrane protein insertase [Erysipelotrichaceae bacterium]